MNNFQLAVHIHNCHSCSPQITNLQDTPELLGFLRNTSSPPRRHKRAVTAAQSNSGKILVSHTYMQICVEKTNQTRCVCFTLLDLFPLLILVFLQNCTNISCLRIMCVVGRLDRGQSAVVKIRSRLWVHTFLQVSVLVGCWL